MTSSWQRHDTTPWDFGRGVLLTAAVIACGEGKGRRQARRPQRHRGRSPQRKRLRQVGSSYTSAA